MVDSDLPPQEEVAPELEVEGWVPLAEVSRHVEETRIAPNLAPGVLRGPGRIPHDQGPPHDRAQGRPTGLASLESEAKAEARVIVATALAALAGAGVEAREGNTRGAEAEIDGALLPQRAAAEVIEDVRDIDGGEGIGFIEIGWP